MKKLFVGLLLSMFFSVQSIAWTKNDSTEVYSELMENQIISISENYKVNHITERKIKVLSSKGLDHAYTSLFYDQINKVISFELEIKDPKSGKTLHKARLKDMSDAAVYSYSTVFDDNRRKYYEVTSGIFPIEVIIRTETSSSTNFYFPKWIPVHNYNQKVIQSTLSVTYPKSIGLRYKEMNLLGSRNEEELENQVTVNWTEKDLPVQEPDLEEEDDHRLLLAPVKFGIDTYNGEMKDWSGLAAWLYQLNEGRNTLPDPLKSKIHELTDEIENPYEKIKTLYTYLQQNFRYVSIQLGIGGWQTMSSEDVAKYAYGDCKGLTNLMKSMLEEAGIESNYTLVSAGDGKDDIDIDFPSNQFNHVILQIPTENQPIWLECTSNLLPAGYLGSFTKNRHVLVTTPEGGYLTKTPAYNDSTWNKYVSSSHIKIDPRGDAWITTEMEMTGNFAEDMLYVKNNLEERKKKDFFNKNSPVSGLIINDLSIEMENLDSLPIAKTKYDGAIQKFTLNTSKRIILKSFMGSINKDMLSSNRLVKSDSYQIELHENYRPESTLDPFQYEEDGIKIQILSHLENNQLKVTREISLDFPEDLAEDEIKEKLNTINSKSVKTYVFLKEESQTQSI